MGKNSKLHFGEPRPLPLVALTKSHDTCCMCAACVQGFNDSLDSGWVQSTGWMARIFLEGVTPVTPEDSWGYQANQAIIGHK